MTASSLPPLGHGVATASYQVEGSLDVDGRGPSIWDVFAARPGAVADGADGSVACGSYERWEEDLDLVRDLGVGAYRFSLAWPRIQPTGRGAVEERGLDHYDRMVDGMLARGLTPLPTLYHWDLPQALEDAGGWPVRDTALRLAEYAAVVAGRLGDRVRTWATVNEPWCSAFLGYAAGVHAPGRTEPAAAYAAAHHLLLGHALAAQAVRSASTAASPPVEVGIVLNLAPARPEPGADPAAVTHVDAVQNRIWLDPLVHGRYPDVLREHLAPVVQDDDLTAVRGSADWLGVNFYTPFRIAPAGDDAGAVGQSTAAYPGSPPFAFAPREPVTAMGWEVDASGLEEVLLDVARSAPGVPLRVTENGAAYDDAVRADDGSVDDQDRIAYLREHLAAVDRARDAGAPVLDYIAWTLLDNYEWAEGYRKKFGIVEVEDTTLRRVPKASYRWFAEHVRAARG
jgi:beta-glucosidase